MKALVGIALALTILSACSKPAFEIVYFPAKDAPDSIYNFTLDFTDSLASYNLYFFSRTDRPSLGGEKIIHMTLSTEWVSPEGETELKETVFLNASSSRGSKELYRSEIRPAPGEWTINVKVGGAPKGFRGLGVMSERINGTR